jgi:hypothetical protein
MPTEGVLIGVDPHKASKTVAVLDPVSRVAVASKRLANTASGYEELRSFADQWPDHRWAVEGCHGAGRADNCIAVGVQQGLRVRDEIVAGHGTSAHAPTAWGRRTLNLR